MANKFQMIIQLRMNPWTNSLIFLSFLNYLDLADNLQTTKTVGHHNLNFMQTPTSVTPETIIDTLRAENSELASKLANSEQQRIIAEKKIEVLAIELAKMAKENSGLIHTVEKERAERLALLQTAETLKNEQTLHDAQAHKYQNLSKTLSAQNESLKSELETANLQKVVLLKEKQNASNKLLLAQTKLQALTMQDTFTNATIASLTAESQRLREENDALSRRLRENSGGYVKTILKDNNQTTQRLVSEFEEKIHSKEMANMEEKQRYETKISQLNLKVAQLQSQLISK